MLKERGKRKRPNLSLSSPRLICSSCPARRQVQRECLKGELISLAIVGASGSGKSTLAHLLLRFYEPQSGTITLDGVDIRELDPTWLRNNISVVPQVNLHILSTIPLKTCSFLQEPQLFSATIAENIAYGHMEPSTVTREAIEQAAEQANALDFIRDMPQGFDTVVGERGSTLSGKRINEHSFAFKRVPSGGQRQRIAIARALINKPKLLILDEATSALDAESEYQVRRALESLLKDHSRTVMIIAHR